MDVHDESLDERTDESVQTDRRGFSRNLKKWSAIMLAGVGLGSAAAKQSRAGWLNRRGGAGWLNRPGGGGWINRRGGGWLNGRR
jgi:hypothetical protein